MYTINLDKGVEQLKSTLETVSGELNSSLNSKKINDIVTAIQLQDDGGEEDIEMGISFEGKVGELLIKSSTIQPMKPKVTISTDSSKLADKIKDIIT